MSHRCHWYENDVGLPLHVPSFPISSSPTRASPVTVGREVFVRGVAFEGTPSVGSERACTQPSALLAMTRTRIVCPRSTWPSLYVLPSAANRRHWKPLALQR